MPITDEGEKANWARETAGFRELAIEQLKRIGIEGVDGIYLMGGGTHGGSVQDCRSSLQSARIGWKLLLEDLRIDPGWSVSSELGACDER